MQPDLSIARPLVDCHLHIWKRDQPLMPTAWYQPQYDAPVEDCLKALDHHGVVFAVVAAASIYGDYNDYVRAALLRHPRLRATAILRPTVDLYQMERMKADGFVGIRLMWTRSCDVPDLDGDYRLYLRRAAELGWHVHLLDRPDRIERSIAAVEEAGARLVIDHLGLMTEMESVDHPGFRAILAAVERGNTWVKLSAKFRFKSKRAADDYSSALMRIAGPERLLWGSDWPFAGFEQDMTYERALEDYEELVPDPALRRQIDENALRLYFT